ncbi:hypothetical protein ACLOJK_012906 [Asimina triloba]
MAHAQVRLGDSIHKSSSLSLLSITEQQLAHSIRNIPAAEMGSDDPPPPPSATSARSASRDPSSSSSFLEISPSKIHSFPPRISSASSIKSSTDIDSPSHRQSQSLAINQSLASILNNPQLGKSGVYGSDASWASWWSSATAASAEFAPLNVSKAPSDVSRAEFQAYLVSIFEAYSRYEDVRNHSSEETRNDMEIKGQGEALVACLREVPSLYFKEDFALEDGATFRVACPFSASAEENVALQDKLSHYLDIVEVHLVKEISLRSDSFFEAQGQLQDLNVEIVDTCFRIRELKEMMRLLDVDLVESARQIQELNATRSNLLALQQKLRLILYVNQALSALKLYVARGASWDGRGKASACLIEQCPIQLVAAADCTGALDVINGLQNLLDGDELTGLHCFLHLRDQLATSTDSVNSILSAEFMRASIHDAKDVDSVILAKLKVRASNAINGKEDEVKLDDEESSGFRDHLLPIITGLLRTAKLPSVLRIYRDALIADMKMTIKTTVAELLPILVARPVDPDFSAGERTVDADVVQHNGYGKKFFCNHERVLGFPGKDRLKANRAHLVRAAEVKKVIEWIMGNLDGCYAADSVAAAVALGAATAAAAESAQENDGQFECIALNSLTIIIIDSADVLRENTEAVFAACDTAHGRWAKLLGVRAMLHPKLRLQEFLSIYNITQDFITATEKIGGRLGYSIRGTIQSQSKAFVDFQHESRVRHLFDDAAANLHLCRMTKIKAVLDQETWVAVDVPDEFQAIVDSLLSPEAFVHDNGVDDYDIATVSRNDRSLAVDGGLLPEQQPLRMNDPTVTRDHPVQVTSSSKDRGNPDARLKASVPVRNDDGNINDHRRSTSQTLMLSEYIDINKCLPSLSSEVVHRVAEILKIFNTRTCQLVLGAGAMQFVLIHCVTEILENFNTKACHLVLGADTMQMGIYETLWFMLSGYLIIGQVLQQKAFCCHCVRFEIHHIKALGFG